MVGGRGAVVHVEDADSAYNGESDQHHGEHQVFTLEKVKDRIRWCKAHFLGHAFPHH